MRTRATTTPDGLTRRRLLQAGGLAGVTMVGSRAWAPAQASAAAAEDGTPGHLLRSSYIYTRTYDYRVDGSATLQLTAVADLPAATADKELAGSEDAFALSFAGPHGLGQGIRTFEHPELGKFELFVTSPGDGTYSAIINRSVGAARHFPKPPKTGDARQGANPAPEPPAARRRRRNARRRRELRRLAARRTRKGVACTVVIGSAIEAKSVTVWLTRGKRVIAAGDATVYGDRAVVRIKTKRRLRPGRVKLTALAHGPHGAQHGRSERLTLR
jgi:hypothetical protein